MSGSGGVRGWHLTAAALCWFFAGLGLATPAAAQSDCSILSQNHFVRTTLEEYYLWYRELPALDPALFDSPEAYLEALRFRPLDERFSYIAPRAEIEAFYSASEFIGLGFSFKLTGLTEMRITQVFPQSPAADAGLARGDYLLAVNGRSIGELLLTGELDQELGPREIGVAVKLRWRTRRGEENSAVMVKRPVTIPTVSQVEVIDVDGLPVGYIHFRNFVEPSVAALDEAFAELEARGVVDVILDLRYNGGGLLAVAQHLVSLVGGSRTTNRVFLKMIHNDKQTALNRDLFFTDPPQALDLQRLVVIATRASASASETVINGLRPFLPVTIIGETTFGKPVGQYGFDFCDKVLFPVAFKSVNALGEGDFFSGIAANCAATDNLDRPLGNMEESSLAEALSFLRTGACSARSIALAPWMARERRKLPAVARDGWHRLVNAW